MQHGRWMERYDTHIIGMICFQIRFKVMTVLLERGKLASTNLFYHVKRKHCTPCDFEALVALLQVLLDVEFHILFEESCSLSKFIYLSLQPLIPYPSSKSHILELNQCHYLYCSSEHWLYNFHSSTLYKCPEMFFWHPLSQDP